MRQSAIRLLRTANIFTILIVSGACTSNLRVDVSVYKGPVADTPSARVYRALGLARTNAKVAMQAATMRPQDAELLSDITTYFDALSLKPSADLQSTELAQLASKLTAYSQHSQSVVRRLGYSELTNPWTRVPIVSLFAVDTDYMAALVDIDENSRLIDALAASVAVQLEDRTSANSTEGAEGDRRLEVFLTRIHHVMQSQAPGSLMIAVREFAPWFVREKIERIYDSLYWGNINPVHVAGAGGEYVTMLVKDDIGNWHLKKAKVDPTKVAEAAKAGAELALRIASGSAAAP